MWKDYIVYRKRRIRIKGYSYYRPSKIDEIADAYLGSDLGTDGGRPRGPTRYYLYRIRQIYIDRIYIRLLDIYYSSVTTISKGEDNIIY